MIDNGQVLALTYIPPSGSLPGGFSAQPSGSATGAVAMAWDGMLWTISGSTLFAPNGTVVPLPQSGAASIISDGTYLWITHPTGIHPGTLTRVLPSRDPYATRSSFQVTQVTVSSNLHTNLGPMAFDGQYVWVVAPYSGYNLFKIDSATGTLASQYVVSDLSAPKAMVFDGYSIWISDLNKIARLSAFNGARTGTYTSGDPRGLVFDGAQVWTADRSSNAIVPIRACDGSSTMKSVTTPTYPEAVAYDGSHLWVVSPTSHTVSIR